MKKTLSILLFILSIVVVPLSFYVACLVGEISVFGIAGVIKYSYIMYAFIPVCLASLLFAIYGIKIKLSKGIYLKNLIASIICIVVLLAFGSYRFMFADSVKYDDIERITSVEQMIRIELPHNVESITQLDEQTQTTYVKILDEAQKIEFEKSISESEVWKPNLNLNIQSSLPVSIKADSYNDSDFVFYNATTDEYNLMPNLEKDNQIIFISYNSDIGRIIIFEGKL